MEPRFRHGLIERAEDGGALRVVLANEGRMGDGLDLRMDGVDLERFEANPIVGYGHAYWGRDSLPIGRVDNLEVKRKRLVGDVTFDQGDEFAVQVERKIRDGFMGAFSIGFDPRAIDDGVVTDWELFELSVVPIPMDPGALVVAGRAGAQSLRKDLLDAAARIEVGAPTTSQDLRSLTERDNTGRPADGAGGGDGGEPSKTPPPEARDRALKLARSTHP